MLETIDVDPVGKAIPAVTIDQLQDNGFQTDSV